jgi:hypothetical protein
VANFSDAWNQVLQECSEMGMSREQHEAFVARIRRIIDFELDPEEDGSAFDGAEALEGYDSDEATPQKHSQLESSSDEGDITEREETPAEGLEIEDGWRGYKYEDTMDAEEKLQDGGVAEEERARWGDNSSTRSIISTKQPSISSKAQTTATDNDEVSHKSADEEEKNNEETPRSTDEA